MREFFHGWRRKAGVVPLVMALALMVGWLRSLIVADYFIYTVKHTSEEHCNNVLSSLRGAIGLNQHWLDRGQPINQTTHLAHHRFPFWYTEPAGRIDLSRFKCRWRYCGFEMYDFPGGVDDQLTGTQYFIPYWSLILPLTLLSCCLLLGTPRKRPPHA